MVLVLAGEGPAAGLRELHADQHRPVKALMIAVRGSGRLELGSGPIQAAGVRDRHLASGILNGLMER